LELLGFGRTQDCDRTVERQGVSVIIVFSKNILRGVGWKKGDHFPSVDTQGSLGVMRNSIESCVLSRNVNPF
jgi:hypothetical protein